MKSDNQFREQGPFAGIRVLDLVDELAVAGTRLLAALGADVVRPEPSGGDSVSHRQPIVTVPQDKTEFSLADVVNNAGKRRLTIEPDSVGFHQIRQLAEAADVVLLTSTSAYVGAFGPSPRQWADDQPCTVLVIVDPFPPHSPFAGKPFTDLTIGATSGFDWYCGAVDGSPEHPKGQLALGYTGIAAAAAAAIGVAARAYGNERPWFELTGQEAFAFACMQSGDPNQWVWHGLLPSRREWGQTALKSLHQCRDGKWLTFVMLGAHFEELADWLDREGVSERFHDEEWLDRDYYNANQEELAAAIAELCRRNDRDNIVREGQSLGLMVMPLSSISDLLADPHFNSRNVFHETATPVGNLRLPRAPVIFSRTPVPAPTVARRVDDVAQLDWEPHARREEGKKRLPLEGMRVADFTWMLAAPVATRILADMGAEIIRIESHARRDMTREIGPQPPGYFSLDTNSTQHHANSNKRSIALNLNHPDAVGLAREIVARSDIVFENYTPGTMHKWGLDAESLLRDRPDLIVVSQPAVGYSGPHAHWGAIGNGVAGYGGLNMLTGFPHRPPFGVGPIVSDLIAPLASVTALLAAVEHRRRTGQGQHLDCGMVEATLWMLDTAFAETQVNRRDPERNGNRSPWMSPHGVFPTKGEDEWIAIAVRTDREWATAAKVLDPDGPLTADERFATFEGRKRDEDSLEGLVSDATRRWGRWELASALLAAGVPAGPVENIRDHLERDEGTKRRYSAVSHPYGFNFLVINQFIRPRGETVPNRRAPMIGEHSDSILADVLGKSREEIADLVLHGVIN